MAEDTHTPVLDIKDKIKFTQHFINNEFVPSISGKTYETINPSTGKGICPVADGQADDIDAAVAAARAAFKLGSPWRRMDASQRGRLLLKLAEMLERDAEFMASMECLNVGKPFEWAMFDMSGEGSGTLRYFAGACDKICGKTIPIEGDYFCYTKMEPAGVVGAILPWNFPIPMLTAKVAPALAAGCTIVVKPAEQSPLTALYFANLVKEAGFPPGVFNVVTGFGPTAGEPLAKHMDVDKITFTGSTVVGKLIMQFAGQSNLKKVTLECGGKSPNVVFADCDLDQAVEESHFAVFFNTGQVCTAGTRTFVHEDIYDKFVEKAVARAKAHVTGDPFKSGTESGPLIDKDQYEKVLNMIESGKKEGAKLMCGGKPRGSEGFFVESTVFADVKDDMRIAREEIFGPVQQILKFKTAEEVIERANKTDYGLAAAVFTNDINKAMSVTSGFQAGLIWVNCYNVGSPAMPFGGYKQSGVGREFSLEGIKEFCEIKTVMIKVPEKNS